MREKIARKEYLVFVGDILTDANKHLVKQFCEQTNLTLVRFGLDNLPMPTTRRIFVHADKQSVKHLYPLDMEFEVKFTQGNNTPTESDLQEAFDRIKSKLNKNPSSFFSFGCDTLIDPGSDPERCVFQRSFQNAYKYVLINRPNLSGNDFLVV